MYDLRLLRHWALDRLPDRVLGGLGALGIWEGSIMGSPAANHAGHTCWTEAFRGTGMWHYGAILVVKSPIRLEMAGAHARQGGRRPAWAAAVRSSGIAGGRSWPERTPDELD